MYIYSIFLLAEDDDDAATGLMALNLTVFYGLLAAFFVMY